MKRWAGVGLTPGGADLLRRLLEGGLSVDVYLPARHAPSVPGVRNFAGPLRHLVRALWGEYGVLVFVASTGLVVRLIAPLLRAKGSDPGIVVVDDVGHYVIPLLGAHGAGAEAAARRISAVLGAVPVFTTASTVRGAPALELVAQREGWALVDGRRLPAVSAALVCGGPVALYQDAGNPQWAEGLPALERVSSPSAADPSRHRGLVVVSDRPVEVPPDPPAVVYCPRTLAVGVGCERGTGPEVVAYAVETALRESGRRRESIAVVATADVKQDEPGIRRIAELLAVPLRSFPLRELARVARRCPTPSAVAERVLGTPGVAEPSALLAAGGGPLLLPKRVVRVASAPGAATVAVARLRAGERPREGSLRLVGIGPGSPAQMTGAARAALEDAEVVVGYGRYVELVRPLLRGGQRVVESPLGAEAARADLALALAREGYRVALVSSGDPGIYGMAARALARIRPDDALAVDVSPGVTALLAAAARVGAPLGDDFAALSLSDRLTPREVMRCRLEAVARSDFVVALYNPRSPGRTEPFDLALRILRASRPPETPVALVRAAYRRGERVRITDLGAVTPEEVDMETLVLVGNSATRVHLGRLITLRREER